MKYSIVLILLILLLQPSANGQRATRKPVPLTTISHIDSFTVRYFYVTLFNTDTVPVLLKLGPTSQIAPNDTLRLARTFPCSDPSSGEYYDLHDLVSEEDNCVRWYTLQLIKPKDSLQFVVKLKDFDKANTSRLYLCYTKEITKTDRELNLYVDPKKIYMQKESRKFKTSYVAINENAPNTSFAEVGLNIYLSTTNQK